MRCRIKQTTLKLDPCQVWLSIFFSDIDKTAKVAQNGHAVTGRLSCGAGRAGAEQRQRPLLFLKRANSSIDSLAKDKSQPIVSNLQICLCEL